MSTVYVAQDAQGRRIEYRDRESLAWGLSVVYPLMPFAGIGLHAATGHPGWLALPQAIVYLAGPLLGWALGEDENNPSEAVVPELESDRYYRWLTYATVPLHSDALIGCAVWAATQPMPVWVVGVLAVVAGMTFEAPLVYAEHNVAPNF
jgi:alkane 1-monooxygenase